MFRTLGTTVPFYNCMTLTFDFVFLAWLAAVMEYVCTNFGVDSSSRFPFKARAQRQTHSQVTDATQLLGCHCRG